jgi:succinate dehydrogenase / fumarate reductase cytochrome b subunit
MAVRMFGACGMRPDRKAGKPYTGGRIMRYRWDIGFVAWLLMRISGALIVVFLLVHLFVLSHLGLGKEAFESFLFVRLAEQPLNKLLELGLIGCLLFHGLNGIRICVIDFGKGVYVQKRLFWAMMTVGAVLFVAAAVPILSHL